LTINTHRLPIASERDVVAAVLDTLQAYGVDASRQNTGCGINTAGRMVRFGRPGDSDIAATLPRGWGPASGRTLHVECERPGFDPCRLRGRARDHFQRQLERLRRTNSTGGFGFWVTDPSQAAHALRRIRDGWRVEIGEAGACWLTDEGSAALYAGERGGDQQIAIAPSGGTGRH
jgi:hypothetical protein